MTYSRVQCKRDCSDCFSYLRTRNWFSLKRAVPEMIENIAEQIIEKDIAYLSHKFHVRQEDHCGSIPCHMHRINSAPFASRSQNDYDYKYMVARTTECLIIDAKKWVLKKPENKATAAVSLVALGAFALYYPYYTAAMLTASAIGGTAVAIYKMLD